MIEQDLTYSIIQSAMEVHSHLGNGFMEVIYQRSLAYELSSKGILFKRELPMTIFYKGLNVGTRRADFFVDEKILVEVKAVISLEDVHLAQAMNYVKACNMQVGLLINFGSQSLQFKRVHNNKLISQ